MEWLNEHLAEEGEVWQITSIQGTKYRTIEVVGTERD